MSAMFWAVEAAVGNSVLDEARRSMEASIVCRDLWVSS
jgi:hypothetical protein